MNSLFALRALLTAGELFFASALIMTLAWFVASQKAAAARHLTWTGALCALLALPVLAEFVPSAFRILLAAPPPRVPVAQMISDVAVPAALPEPVVSGISLDPSTIALALSAIWFAGVCAIALRFAIAALCLAALKHRSRPFALAPEDLPDVTATRRECELRLSQSEHGPVTWGVFRPVILLPKTAIFWPRERLHAVLLHELAHIRRRDSLAQALSLLVCALYWPNPLVWLGARALRREAEIAADDSVIVAGFKPSQYAGELLQLAAEFRTQRPALSAIPLSMAAPSALEARVKSVLAPTAIRSGVTSMDVLKITGLGLLATTAIAFARPSLAQDTTSPPPPPPAAIAAPEAPPPPDAPPSIPAPPAAPTIATTPAAPGEATAPTAADSANSSVYISADGHEHALTPSERRHIRVVIEKARREAREAMAKARPEMEKAMVEARASREAMRAEIEKAVAEAKVSEQTVRDAQPQIDAAMAEIAKKRPEIDRAMAEAQPEIDKAMAEAQPEIDAALAKVRAELAKDHLDANIQMRVDAALKRAEIRIEAVKAHEHGDRHDERTEERTEERTTTDTPDND